MSELYGRTLDIVFWDVQHGNAIYINTPNDTKIVQDLGIGSYGYNNEIFSPLQHLNYKYGINELDAVIITHPDYDHIADILNLDILPFYCLTRPKSVNRAEIEEKIEAARNYSEREIFEKYIEITKRYIYPVPDEYNPLLPKNNGGVNFEIYCPIPDLKTHRINNHSIVTVISFAGSKILLPGDNESPSWEWLLNKNSFRNSIQGTDIFLASHHGRESGYCNDLFQYFKPNLTIISDGHVCDTSATSRYSSISKGWVVHKEIGQANREYENVERKCLTTRKDGVIIIKMGYNPDGKPYLDVRI